MMAQWHKVVDLWSKDQIIGSQTSVGDIVFQQIFKLGHVVFVWIE
jgi:hypothetical protein